MRYYVVRHKTTQQMLVLNTGASWWEPDTDERVDHTKIAPRLFKSSKAAKSFISSWARGRVVKRQVAGMYEPEEYLEVEPVPTRDKSQLEVVPCFLTFGEPFK